MTKYVAFGVIVQVDHDSDGTYTTIGQLGDIDGPNEERDSVDVTTHDSANNAREYKPNLSDGGEVTLDVVYDPGDSTQQIIVDIYRTRAQVPWKFILPDTASSEVDFTAHVQSHGLAAPMEDKLMKSVTLKVTGKVDWPGEDV